MSNIGPGVRPHLIVEGGIAALEFYARAFGAVEVHERVMGEGGRLLHGEVTIAGTVVYICDDFPELNGGKPRNPRALGAVPVVLHQCVADCDRAVERAAAAGARVVTPAADQYWGDRYGVVEDPFGFQWSFSHPLVKR